MRLFGLGDARSDSTIQVLSTMGSSSGQWQSTQREICLVSGSQRRIVLVFRQTHSVVFPLILDILSLPSSVPPPARSH